MPNPESGSPRILMPIAEAVPFPDALRRAEWPSNRPTARVGIGLSGGGIRSATFSLGFFQGLAHWGLLRHVDYLSTVSGGGYFGAFYGHLIQRLARPLHGAADYRPPAAAVEAAERELSDPASKPLRFLRENGRYLSPNGAGDVLIGAASAIRSLAAILVVMGSLALLVLTLVVLGRLALPETALVTSLPPALSWISPLFAAAVLAVALLALPVGWAYWLVPPGGRQYKLRELLGQWAAPVAASGTAVAMMVSPFGGPVARSVTLVLGTITTLTVGRYLLAQWNGRKATDPDARTAMMRGELTRGLTRALLVTALLLGLALVDSLGGWIALQVERGLGDVTLSVYGGLVAVGAWLRKRVARLAAGLGANEAPTVPVHLLINVGAVLLIVALLGGLAAIPNLLDASARSLWILAGALGGIVLAVGGVWSFVNHSSLHAMYEARLRRAYLGATNPVRFREGENHPPITDPHPDDGMTMAAYNPARDGGPVHLINVTVNETVDGRSQVQQRDRKGVGMAVGPGGVSVGRTHHAAWEAPPPDPSLLQRVGAVLGHKGSKEAVQAARGPAPEFARHPDTFRVFPGRTTPEHLDVGQWIAISGAAFSTGLGSRTSLGLSLLAGLFNVRLGYWWGSGVDPDQRVGRPKRTTTQRTLALLRRSCAVQSALLDEWLARFPGVARREWYLSDGGHFENLGGYELIRRRLPFIVLCDNEQDADYQFQGLGNLVRKARVDFNTEITFLSERELCLVLGPRVEAAQAPDWRTWVGPLEALRRGRRVHDHVLDPLTGAPRSRTEAGRREHSLAHASLARVRYPTVGEQRESEGWLLYVKPTLVGDEPPDLAHYHGEHPDFPHQATADQFFDEAQWESYRKLGELIARKLFDGISDRDTTLHQWFRGETPPTVDPSIALEVGSVEWMPLHQTERER